MITDPSSLPSLPTSLASYYSELSEMDKKVFNRVYRVMWDTLLPMRRFTGHGGVMYSYWIVDKIREKYDLSVMELSVLSFMYHISNCGKQIIDGKAMQSASSLPCAPTTWKSISMRLGRRGFFKRSVRNPAKPLINWRVYGKKYIRLTDKTINLMKDMEEDLYRMMRKVTFDDIVAGKAKGQL